MAERKNPELITPAYDTIRNHPIHWKTSIVIVETTRHFSRIRNLLVIEPDQESKIKRATRFVSQNIEDNELAYFSSATPAFKA
jgi:hypothetical protein